MKVLFVCAYLSLVVCSWAVQHSELEWEDFKLQYQKKYSSAAEERQRQQIFLKNKEKVAAHNVLYDKGVVTFTIGTNKFSDRFPEELAAMRGYRAANSDHRTSADIELSDIDLETGIPDSIDWRKKGAVTPVKDQGQCGSCWAFSAVGSLEGQHFRRTNKLVSLSEQNLVDCDHVDDGCQGGEMSDAFQYVMKNGGIDTEASYPYTATPGKCHYKAKNSGSNCTGYKQLPKGDEEALKAAVAKIGPISVSIDASSIFSYYVGGVYYNPHCSASNLDHAVLVVGYGTKSNGKDYWIVKNSYGSSWGNQGYILMSRNKNNNCGIASMAIYPVV